MKEHFKGNSLNMEEINELIKQGIIPKDSAKTPKNQNIPPSKLPPPPSK